MANVKITDLTAYTNPDSTDVLPIVDVGADVTKKVSVGEVVGKISGDVDVATDGTSSIALGVIVDADVNASAAIAGTKIDPDFGSQTIETTGDLAINTNVLFVDSSAGRCLVGTSNAITGTTSTVSSFQLHGTNGGTASPMFTRWQNTTAGPPLLIQKSRGAEVETNGVVQEDDEIGRVDFAGDDGSGFETAARIAAFVDGDPDPNDDGQAENGMPGRLVFSSNPGAPATSPSEAMRINSAQELLIGYTTDNGAYKLQVNSQIFATSATIATSDGRYKENVASLNGCLDLVKALRPVSFTWKPQEDITRLDDEGNEVLVREGHNFPEGTQVGFIAQEVQEVLDGKPWLGSVIKENVRPAVKDNDGNELAPEEQFYGIAEGNLIAVLTNALQEATAKIEDLEARLTAAGL